MKVFQHVNIVTCDQDFHVYLDDILYSIIFKKQPCPLSADSRL